MNFFKNKKIKKIKDSYSMLESFESSWSSLFWNLNLDSKSKKSYSLELTQNNSSFLSCWREIEDGFYLIQSNSHKENLDVVLHHSEAEELKILYNLAVHQVISTSLDSMKAEILTPVIGATTQALQDEARSLEWIKTSFKVLNSALEKIQVDSSFILTAGFFAGIEPKTNKNLLRLIAMNLDIFFYFEEDSSLRIVVYNDKNMGHSSAETPVFNQIIKVTKPQFYDEMIRLVNKVALVGDFSC